MSSSFQENRCCRWCLRGNFSLEKYKGKYVVIAFVPLAFSFVCPTAVSYTHLDVYKRQASLNVLAM